MVRGPRASPQARGRRPLLRVIARSARGGAPVPTRRSPEEGSSGSRAVHSARRPSARPTNPPSSRRAFSSWVPPDPTRRSPWVAAPCLPHSSPISELMKRAKSVICRPSFHPLTAFSGERERRGLIAAAAPLARGVPATRARPSERSPADRQVTAHRHGRRRKPCSPITARSETPLPTGTANACAEIRLCGAWHRAPAVGRTLLPQPPPHAAIGRRERVLSSELMPGAPPAGGAAKPQQVRHYSDPNRIQGFQETASGYARNTVTLSRASAPGAQAQTAEDSHP